MQAVRTYPNKMLDADSDFSIIEPGSWVNAKNIRTFTTDKGAVNRVESIGGTTTLFDVVEEDNNYCIGGCVDVVNKRIVWINWNDTNPGNHAIYCYDIKTGVTYNVLFGQYVEGGLGFSKYSYIHSCFIIGDLFYWTDGVNEPRRINLKRAINITHPLTFPEVPKYDTPIAQTIISQIRKPPTYAPWGIKDTDGTSPNNFIKDKAFKFAWMYDFVDNEMSVLSVYSQLFNVNAEAETYNRITVKMDGREFIPQDAQKVHLLVQNVATNTFFIVKTWDKDITADATEIHNHNISAPGLYLTYQFYNDIIGETLDPVHAAKIQDNIARTAQTIELARNRQFQANVLLGYNTPKQAAISPYLITLDTVTNKANGYWHKFYVTIKDISSNIYTGNKVVIFIPATIARDVAGGPYYTHPSATTPPANDTTSLSAYTHYAISYREVVEKIAAEIAAANSLTGNYSIIEYYEQAVPDYINNSSRITSVTQTYFANQRVLKSNASYRLSIEYFDKYMRRTGTVDIATWTNNPRKTTQLFWNTNNPKGIRWTLQGPQYIPDYAHYYQVVMTNNRNTDFFIQSYAKNLKYVKKDAAGLYTYSDTYSTDTYALAINVAFISEYGMGYQFTEGSNDTVILQASGSAVFSEVIGTDGEYVFIKPYDFGVPLTSIVGYFEIYNPTKKTQSEIFYERSEIFTIVNPGTISKAYSATHGFFRGDVYLFTSTKPTPWPTWSTEPTGLVESMSPNNKYWQTWHTDAGRINAYDSIGEQQLENTIIFSNVYIPGTRVNGLSSFEVLNEKTLNAEDTPIQKLQLTNKIQEQGTIMLAICKAQTISCYLGEAEINDTQGVSFVAKSNAVIGSVNALQGGFGTINPESVIEYNGTCYWWDIRNGAAVRYAANGLFPISSFKLNRVSDLFSKAMASLNKTDIEALGSFPYIIPGVDAHHKEVLFSIPTTLAAPPKGILEDYNSPDIIYPYDIYDGEEKTLIFKPFADGWIGSMGFQAEKFFRIDTDTFCVKNGKLYKMNNTATPAKFFGEQQKCSLIYSFAPGQICRYLSLGIEANKPPSFVHFRTEYPRIQSSHLTNLNFKPQEGVWYASMFRDRLSPNAAGTYLQKQLQGDYMFGRFLLAAMEFDVSDSPLALTYITTSFNVSQGHMALKT